MTFMRKTMWHMSRRHNIKGQWPICSCVFQGMLASVCIFPWGWTWWTCGALRPNTHTRCVEKKSNCWLGRRIYTHNADVTRRPFLLMRSIFFPTLAPQTNAPSNHNGCEGQESDNLSMTNQQQWPSSSSPLSLSGKHCLANEMQFTVVRAAIWKTTHGKAPPICRASEAAAALSSHTNC